MLLPLLRRHLALRSSCLKMSTSAGEKEVLFRVENNAGIVTLNRPKALNALTFNMVKQMYEQLVLWRKENKKVVLVEGSGGKAFCAGGDIRAITSEKGSQMQKDFFREEYLLDNLTQSLGLPYVSLIDGIVMGGGVGISVHAPFRVATEKTVLAMPETGIGLIPDVGGSFFLSRMKNHLGTYLALTGDRLKGEDCLHAGVVTHFCQSEQLDDLKRALVDMGQSSDTKSVLDNVCRSHATSQFSFDPLLPSIEKAFGKDTVEDIEAELAALGNDFGEKTLGKLKKMSPTSLKVTLCQIRRGSELPSLEECLKMEYRLVRRCCEDSDFYEGVRALLVEKDNKPKWNPASIQEVTQDMVDRYFSPLPEEEELKF